MDLPKGWRQYWAVVTFIGCTTHRNKSFDGEKYCGVCKLYLFPLWQVNRSSGTLFVVVVVDVIGMYFFQVTDQDNVKCWQNSYLVNTKSSNNHKINSIFYSLSRTWRLPTAHFKIHKLFLGKCSIHRWFKRLVKILRNVCIPDK